MGEIPRITNWAVGTPSHHHGLVHPIETVYLSETKNHCKNFEETFLKTSRTVWVTIWWVEESWCLRLHKVRCCYDLHSLKWKPWVIQLKPGSGGSSRQQAGAVFAHKLIWLPAWNWNSSSQDTPRRKTVNMSWGVGSTHYLHNNMNKWTWTVFDDIMHISSEIFSLSHISCIHLINWILPGKLEI